MKCLRCGARMRASRENHRYDHCGLTGVTLIGVEINRCPKCGEYEVTIPKIEELHRLISIALIRKPARLAPAEIRFLRKYLGWSGRDFAEHVGVSPETVSRWEQGQDKMGISADRLLRLMVSHVQPASDYSLDVLKDVAKGEPRPIRMGLEMSRKGWREAA